MKCSRAHCTVQYIVISSLQYTLLTPYCSALQYGAVQQIALLRNSIPLSFTVSSHSLVYIGHLYTIYRKCSTKMFYRKYSTSKHYRIFSTRNTLQEIINKKYYTVNNPDETLLRKYSFGNTQQEICCRTYSTRYILQKNTQQ